MSYSVILSEFILFLASICLHVIVWRLLRPKSYLKALSAVFFIVPASVFVIYVILFPGALPALSSFDTADLAALFLLYLLLAAAYILSYPSIQARSPSLLMLLVIEESMPRGRKFGELERLFSSRGLVGDRLDDLLQGGFIKVSGQGCSITFRGRLLLGPFALLRRLLGLPAGEG